MTIKNETYFEFDDDLNEGFTTVPNYILNDKRLSFKAVGVYVQILQYRNTGKHKVYLKSLSNYRTDKKTAVSTGMKELEEHGYISKIHLRNEKGQMNGIKYIVRMKPIVQTVENTNAEPKAENLISDNPHSDNTTLKIKCFKKENGFKKENDVVVVNEKETQLLKMYKSFKLQKRFMPQMKYLLLKYIDKFDLEVFEQIFILAAEDSVKSKYAYLADTFDKLLKKNIVTLEQYNQDQEQFKKSKQKKIYSKGSNQVNTKKGAGAGVNNSFNNYDQDELEKLLKESQSDKFNSKVDTQEIDVDAIRKQAVKNVQDKTVLPVVEGDPIWERVISEEIERLSKEL